jgi:hypothetical protein
VQFANQFEHSARFILELGSFAAGGERLAGPAPPRLSHPRVELAALLPEPTIGWCLTPCNSEHPLPNAIWANTLVEEESYSSLEKCRDVIGMMIIRVVNEEALK